MVKRGCGFFALLILALGSGAARAAISSCIEVDAKLAGNISEEMRSQLEDEQRICALPVDDITPADALTLLKGSDVAERGVVKEYFTGALTPLDGHNFAVERRGDVFTVVAKTTPDQAVLCCTFQTEMSRIQETDLYAARFRAARLDEAMIMLTPPSESTQSSMNSVVWRGPNAPADPTPAYPLTVEKKREKRSSSIVYKEFWSDALGETRRVVIYLPTDYKRASKLRVLIVADGLGKEPSIVEEQVRAGRYPPFVVIGVDSGQNGIVEDRSALGIDDLRAAEYLPGYEESHHRFENHLTFVIDELLPALREEFGLPAPPDATVVAGKSNGAVFALYAALRRPDEIGAALVLSQGVLPAEPGPESPRARFFFSAGLYEPTFLSATHKSAETLSTAGYDVTFVEYVAGHASDQWDVALIDGLNALFAEEGDSEK